MPADGTPRRIGPIADEVLAWVANERAPRNDPAFPYDHDALRRIELCALAAREAAMFHDLYGLEGVPYAAAPDLPDER